MQVASHITMLQLAGAPCAKVHNGEHCLMADAAGAKARNEPRPVSIATHVLILVLACLPDKVADSVQETILRAAAAMQESAAASQGMVELHLTSMSTRPLA